MPYAPKWEQQERERENDQNKLQAIIAVEKKSAESLHSVCVAHKKT
jgi:hypothetical protein